MLPAPLDLEAPVPVLVAELAGHLGGRATVELCVALLGGADREDHLDALPFLTGFSFATGAPARSPESWKNFWVRTWGARGLLYVWDGSAVPAVVASLADPDWRPAEMCLKVATRHEVGEAGPGAVALAGHRLPRVRAQALRTLGTAGDTEHVAVVRSGLGDPSAGVRRAAVLALDRLAVRLDRADLAEA